MKEKIHPVYYPEAIITCSCGNIIRAGATKEKLSTELCSACHPFYTGKQKLIDTAKRVDKFEERKRKAAEIKQKMIEKKAEKIVAAGKKQEKIASKTKSKTKKVKALKGKTKKIKAKKKAKK